MLKKLFAKFSYPTLVTCGLLSTGVAFTFAPIKQSVATSDYHSISGVACQPANLGQALNLGMQWNQINVLNPNPPGGPSFFVTCPVQFDEGTNFDGGQPGGLHDIYVFLDKPPTTGNVTCTAFRYDHSTGPNNAASAFNFARTVSRTATVSSVNAVRLILSDVGSGTIDALTDYFVVLCALPPGTGVDSIHFDYD